MVEIVEGTVGVIAGLRVGVGNIWTSHDRPADDPVGAGPTAQLFLPDQTLLVGEGSLVRLNATLWRVISLREGPAEGHGSITLAPAD